MPSMDADLVQLIRGFELPATEPPAGVVRSVALVEGEGAPIPVRIHRPLVQDRAGPCVVSMHGGGYVIGSATMDDPLFDDVTPSLGVVGVSVDYRLAPESPYPGPLEDCYRALLWTHEHVDELGVDPDRIGVHGLSAGGGLAAALALLARQRGEVGLAFQVLDSPMLDDRQVTASSRVDGLPVWSRESNTFGWRSYLGDRYGADDIPSTAAAARATDAELASTPADVRVRRCRRRLPRRGRGVRATVDARGCGDGAPRVRGCMPRLPDGRRQRGRVSEPARSPRVARSSGRSPGVNPDGPVADRSR